LAGAGIAGGSLFGGRGRVWAALLGALVIGSISNGMDLLALESSVKFMVTGGVLLVAVIIDALGRRQRGAAPRPPLPPPRRATFARWTSRRPFGRGARTRPTPPSRSTARRSTRSSTS